MSRETKFWAKVKKQDGCWEWQGSKMANGYGQCGHGGYAHRYSYEINKGPIPDGLFVRHSCDNRACVNPTHLDVGTQVDNMADMFARKRGVGRDGYTTNAKLNPDDVRAVRRMLAAGMSLTTIGKQFSVSKQVISYIKLGKTWAWVQ